MLSGRRSGRIGVADRIGGELEDQEEKTEKRRVTGDRGAERTADALLLLLEQKMHFSRPGVGRAHRQVVRGDLFRRGLRAVCRHHCSRSAVGFILHSFLNYRNCKSSTSTNHAGSADRRSFDGTALRVSMTGVHF